MLNPTCLLKCWVLFTHKTEFSAIPSFNFPPRLVCLSEQVDFKELLISTLVFHTFPKPGIFSSMFFSFAYFEFNRFIVLFYVVLLLLRKSHSLLVIVVVHSRFHLRSFSCTVALEDLHKLVMILKAKPEILLLKSTSPSVTPLFVMIIQRL